MNAIDQYVAELSTALRVGRRGSARILTEIRDHLDDATGHRLRAGMTPDDAVAGAIAAFGPPAMLADQFNGEAGTRAMRRAPVVAFTAGVTVFVGLVFAARAQPRPAVPMDASVATQVSFFVAVLAFQVAVVAGMCAASRAVARSRAAIAHRDDRRFVRRATIVSTIALGVAAASWATTLWIGVERLTHPDTAATVMGGAIMLGAAMLAIAAAYRLRVNAADESGAAPTDPPLLFNLGEESVAVVRRHPVLSCTAVAALSVWPAMAHAETSVAGALPWGIAQAVAVVVAFVVLGPVLELRQPHVA